MARVDTHILNNASDVDLRLILLIGQSKTDYLFTILAKPF